MKHSLLITFFLSYFFIGNAQTSWKKLNEGLILNNPPFTACHAPSIVELSPGEMMVSFFAGSGEGNKDVSIWLTTMRENRWSKPYLIADGIINDTLRYPCWNPVLFKSKDGTLFLFYKVGPNPREWWGMVKTSSDNGKSWTDPQKLPIGILGPIKNKPVQLEDGTILSPSSIETESAWKVHMERSTDMGKSWKVIPVDSGSSYKVIQPGILLFPGGRMQIVCRSDQNRIVYSWSEDKGESWSPFQKLDLPNPNSGIDAVTLQNGMQLLVYNPTIRGKEWFNNRGKLNVAVSKDGVNWKVIAILENGNSEEYSYPAVIQARDGNVHITYTYDRKNIKYVVLASSELTAASSLLNAQTENLPKTSAGFPINYDEEKAGNYTLPDVLTLKNGKKVTSVKTWNEQRRPELVKLFEEHQFGKVPPRPIDMTFHVFDKGTPAFNGKAIRKQVTVYFTKDTSKHKMDLLIYLPANTNKPAPLFLVISFAANSTAVDDPGIKPGYVWTREGKRIPASEARSFGKLDVNQFINEGIGIATVYYGDIEPDFKTGIQYGIRGHYLSPGTTQPAPDEWGAIAAWSWGLSRAMDYFETDRQIDAKRIALQGTSRLGKTVLWTGARDPRFKLVIASCSGEGGAALSRRDYGENIAHMTDTSRYYYQFAPNRHNYIHDFDSAPVDAHMLVALMAPRPLLLQTGDTDYWSDPKGEFLAAVAAEPVYKLFGKHGPRKGIMPKAGEQTMLNTLGYYLHAGGHGVIPSDWPVFLAYLKKYL